MYAKGLERSDLASKVRLAVRSLVLVDNALAHSLVELARRNLQLRLGSSLVTGRDCLTSGAHNGTELALVGAITLRCFLVGLDALDLRLNICHVGWSPYYVRKYGVVRAVREGTLRGVWNIHTQAKNLL